MDIFIQILPWCVTIVGTASFWLIPRHTFGWITAIMAQLFYLPFVLLTHEWGFLAHALFYSAAFVHNYIFDERHPHIQRAIANGTRKPKSKVAA